MIYAYREVNRDGNYQAADGTRYLVHTARRVHGAKRACWREYESVEAALEEMQLEPILIPEMDENGEAILTEPIK